MTTLPPELRDQAVAMIHAHPGPGAITDVSTHLRIAPATLRTWLREHRVATGEPDPTAADVPAFPDQLLHQLYGLPCDVLYRRLSLVPVTEVSTLRTLRSRHARILVAVNRRFVRRPVPSAIAVTIGGSLPINTTQIGYDTITEIVVAVTTAARLDRPCVIYLHEAWHPLAAAITDLVDRLLSDLRSPAQATVVTIAAPDVDHLLRATVEEHRDHLASITSTAPPRHQDEIPRSVRYLPAVVGELLGRSIQQVIVAGALHHVRAAAVAHRLASNHGHRVDILGHVPAPDATGTRLAADAPSTQRLPLGNSAETTVGRLGRAPASVRGYWAAAWHVHNTALTARRSPSLIAMTSYYQQIAATMRLDGPPN